MATQVSAIITAAINSSTANDLGASSLAANSAPLVEVIARVVRKVYALAGTPPDPNEGVGSNFFTRTATVVLGTPNTTYVSLGVTPEFFFLQNIRDNAGAKVSVVTLRDLNDAIAELPPAVVFADAKIRSAGRVGDPAAGATLTFDGSYLPAVLTDAAHYIGATTPTDSTSTAWPGYVGDNFLVAQLCLYLAQKDGARDPEEIQGYVAQIAEHGEALARVIGASSGRVSAVRPT